MPAAATDARPAPVPKPPVRIRTVLAVGALAAAIWTLHPRAVAAWKLHASATTLADYALCMAGPTGPALLRDGSAQFRALVRRRLVTAEAAERPFESCARAARELTGSADAERAHRAAASSFVEYGGVAADRAQAGGKNELSLDDLAIGNQGLAELSRTAWPFVREGYVKLVKPSLSAVEAVHPVELARPAVGRGLPTARAGYRAVGQVDGALTLALGKAANLSVLKSSDGGVSWRPAPVRGALPFAERCPAGERSYTLQLSNDGAATVVTSFGPDAPPHAAVLAKSELEVAAIACDERALIALTRHEGARELGLVACAFRAPCRALPLPRSPGLGVGQQVDVARVQGTTVVAVTAHGVVRVASSRDEGQSWTPFSVAYDDAAHPELRVDGRVPSRLLGLGKRVLLYAGASKPNQSYSVLASDDAGASWRTP